jgi:hypothetical protein
MQARHTFDKKPPTCASILSSSTSFSVARRPTSGLDSSSATIKSTGRPLMPPILLMRSTAMNADERGPAAGSGVAGQRLQDADLIGRGLAKGRPPRRRHQHRRRTSGCTPTEHAPPRDLGAPEFPLLAHRGSFP